MSAASAVRDAAGRTELLRRDSFAAYVAHELRDPIALQRALVEVTLADPDADAVALREMGERVVASCVRQQHLIESLLDLVRPEGGLTRRKPVDLAAIAAGALRTHCWGEIARIVDLAPAWTAGDSDLLGRLAANLVSNAIRHNVAGGRIGVSTCAEQGRVVLAVTNTGPSIPPSDIQRLFQPFERLDSQLRSSADGVGLGLAIVQAVADAHDAVVTARARTGGGLRISVAFHPLD